MNKLYLSEMMVDNLSETNIHLDSWSSGKESRPNEKKEIRRQHIHMKVIKMLCDFIPKYFQLEHKNRALNLHMLYCRSEVE